MRSVYLRQIMRAGTPVPIFPATRVQRGDILTLVGPTRRIEQAVSRIGIPDRATDATDMVLVAFGIVAGALIGIPAFMLGRVEIGLSLSVGVLFGGLVCGWLRSMWPRFFGRIPSPTLWVFESLGLAGFVAIVGLNAGPDFVVGLRTSGPTLVVAGLLTVFIPHLVGVVVGQVGIQDAPGRPAWGVRGGRDRDAGARGNSGGGEEPRPDARIRRGLRGRQRAPCALGHGHRRSALKLSRQTRHLKGEQTSLAATSSTFAGGR